MAPRPFPPKQQHPIPIWLTGLKYLVFDSDDAAYLRAEYRICGVAIGTLPQVPQQNVFSGLPLQLMAEEAQLLVEEGVAVVLDNAQQHQRALSDSIGRQQEAYRAVVQREGQLIARAVARNLEDRKRIGLQKQAARKQNGVKKLDPESTSTTPLNDASIGNEAADQDEGEVPSNDIRSPSISSSTLSMNVESHAVTLSTSTALLRPSPDEQTADSIPVSVPRSYPLFRDLHDQGYYISPGLRFGCQYLVYPGDPLRFHSHFSAISREWDEDFNLIDIVSGGRLGTGVKKAFLMGGEVAREEKQWWLEFDRDEQCESNSERKRGMEANSGMEAGGETHTSREVGRTNDVGALSVRSFSIEWAGM